VDPGLFRTLLDALYTGILSLSRSTALPLFGLAQMYEIAAVPWTCEQYLCSQLASVASGEAMLAMAERASEHNALGVLRQAGDFLALDFVDLRTDENLGFLSVTLPVLVAILESDKLADRGETKVFDFVVAWMEHDPVRKADAAQLATAIRWALIPPVHLSKAVLSHPLFVGADGFQEAMMFALRWHATAGDTQHQRELVADAANPKAVTRRELIRLKYTADFDESGVMFYCGTAGDTRAYRNPHGENKSCDVKVSSNTARGNFDPAKIVQRMPGQATKNSTGNNPSSYVEVSLPAGVELQVDHYCLRHGQPTAQRRLRSWDLLGSANSGRFGGTQLTVLRAHTNDESLPAAQGANGATASWAVEPGGWFNTFRIQLTGQDSSESQYLSCAGIELYGFLRLPEKSPWK
jgi:hypothetical protein